jgi:HEAT repeat protein
MKTILYSIIVAASIGTLAPNRASAQTSMRPNPRIAGGIIAIPITTDPADSLYRAARAVLTDGDYRRAASMFKQVTEKYPKSELAQESMYWRAWALYQSGSTGRNKGDLDEALNSLRPYMAVHTKGSQRDDAAELWTRIRNAQASMGDARAAGDVAVEATRIGRQGTCTGSKSDEEMRMAALDGLLTMSSEDAVPILKEVLKQTDNCRIDLRKKAVWLISQKHASDAVPTLLSVARNDPSMDVRGEAIFWLSQANSNLAASALDSILFAPNADAAIRKKAVFALSQQHDERASAALRRAAEDERMPEEVREEAVFWLGNSKLADLDYFKSLFKKTKNPALQNKVLFSINQSSTPQASAALLDIAKDKSIGLDTRKEALFWAGQHNTVDIDQIESVYNQSKGEEEMQKQVLFVYSQRREPAAVDKLMTIAKSDSNIEMRKDALFWLGQKNDPRVKQFIRDLINK